MKSDQIFDKLIFFVQEIGRPTPSFILAVGEHLVFFSERYSAHYCIDSSARNKIYGRVLRPAFGHPASHLCSKSIILACAFKTLLRLLLGCVKKILNNLCETSDEPGLTLVLGFLSIDKVELQMAGY